MSSHATWENPSNEELKQLKAAMVWKAARLLLYSLGLALYLLLIVWLRDQDFDFLRMFLIMTIIVAPLMVYYYCYRCAIVFGRHYIVSEVSRIKSIYVYVWGFINFILAIVFIIFENRIGVIKYILIALMALFTYWKEYFMLLLFAMKKYTVKDGSVFFHKKEKVNGGEDFDMSDPYGWYILAYVLDFEDAENRKIPVMVDRYTYRRFKENGDAILINYKYGDSYMFEIIRVKIINN